MRVLELIQPCDFTPGPGDATGRPGVSHCRACARDVHDLSAMTGDEAKAFLARPGPNPCVRYQRDEDDLIHFADGPNGIVGRIARDARPMISVASLLLAACTNTPGQEANGHGESTAKPIAIEATSTSAVAPSSSSEAREDGGATASASASAVAAPSAPSAAASGCVPVASAKVGSGGRGTPKPLTTINGYF